MYGGIRAERPETSLALGATAGQVLTYGGHVIVAYYSSDSGGRTAAVQDAFAGYAPEPYLVSVPDPYDTLSPHRRLADARRCPVPTSRRSSACRACATR